MFAIVHNGLFFIFLLFFFLQAGLLGCEAVLSSMALMQASSMAAPPKKMIAPLGHAPPQREGPDRAPQSHMILPSGMSCPPLVSTYLEMQIGRLFYAMIYSYYEECIILPLSNWDLLMWNDSHWIPTYYFSCVLSWNMSYILHAVEDRKTAWCNSIYFLSGYL